MAGARAWTTEFHPRVARREAALLEHVTGPMSRTPSACVVRIGSGATTNRSRQALELDALERGELFLRHGTSLAFFDAL
jgi:hypothetical protein